MESVTSLLEVRSYSIVADAGKFYIEGPIFETDTDPDITPEILKRDIAILKGKELRIEHLSPDLDPYVLVGDIKDVWWNEKDNRPWMKASVGDDSDLEKEIRADLIEDQKKPVDVRKWKGFSIGIIKYFKRNGNTRVLDRIFPREASLTGDPVCKPCIIKSVRQYNMSADPSKMSPDIFAKQVEVIGATYSKQLEMIEGNFKRQVAEYSATIKTQQETIVDQKKVISERETSLSNANGKIAVLEKDKAALQIQVDSVEKVPLVEDLIRLGQYGGNKDLVEKKRAALMLLTKEQLSEKLEDYKRFLKIYGRSVPPQLGNQIGQPPATGSGIIPAEPGQGGVIRSENLGGF